MDSINLESFLSLSNKNVDDDIKNILLQNELEFNKLNESIIMLNEILQEEKENKDKLLKELNIMKNTYIEAENLFSKIITLCMELN